MIKIDKSYEKDWINSLKKNYSNSSNAELINMYQYYTDNNIRGVKLCSTQRGPAWASSNINILLSDVYNESQNIKFRFFGSILLSDNINFCELIDGQQRTTFGLIFIAIIRDILHNLSKNKNTQKIKSLIQFCNILLFNTKKYSYNKSKIFLSLTNYNKKPDNKNYPKLFHRIITGQFNENYSKNTYKPIHLVESAYEAIYNGIENLFKANSSNSYKVNLLHKLLRTFLQKFVVTIIHLSPSEFNNNITFETTNDRGANLQISDKVKSQLTTFTQMYSDNPEIFQKNWDKQISEPLQSDANIMSNFLVDFWHAKGTRCAGKRVPSEIHKAIKKKHITVEELMKYLTGLSKVYRTLWNPKGYHYSQHIFKSINLRRIIQELDDMGLSQYYSIVLAMYQFYPNCYTKDNIYKVMKKVLKIEMRRQIHHAVHAQYTTEAHNIWKNHNKLSVNDILQDLNHYLYPDKATQIDCEIYDHRYINSTSGKNKSMLILTYILANIYKKNNNDFESKSKNRRSDKLYNKIFSNHYYQAVHIFPNKINGKANDLVNNIGNWTILTKTECSKFNIDPNNPDTNTLNKALNESKLRGNKVITLSLDGYNNSLKNAINIIKARQKSMANGFIHAWKN